MDRSGFYSALILLTIGFVSALTTGPTHNKVVVCYIGTWATYRPDRGSFEIESLDPSLCTHLIYSFVGLDVHEDSIRVLDKWQDLPDGKKGFRRVTALKNRYPHLKITLAIGGWNEGSANYSALAADPQRRAQFVVSAVDFLKKYNFDGLDLDWEFPGKRGGSPADKANFLLLVKELKTTFKKHKLLLTAAFGAGKDTIDVAYDVAGLSVYLDFIHMMCYDYHGAWDQMTGANAPLRSKDVLSVEYSIEYMLKLGAIPRKLVMGVPFYGRTFILPESPSSNARRPRLGLPATNTGFQGPFTRENGFMGYNEICLELRNTTADWVRYWDETSATPFVVSGDRLIAYDDAQSIGEKVRFAMEKNLGGVMIWSVDTDDFRGDCADDGSNYPLLHAIDRSIIAALEDLENDVVQDDPWPRRPNAASGIGTISTFGLVFGAVLCSFL